MFRGHFLALLDAAHAEGRLQFFNTHAGLADKRAFKRFLAPLRRIDWVVYCKDPFGGPEQVLRYLSRYTVSIRRRPPCRVRAKRGSDRYLSRDGERYAYVCRYVRT